MLHVCTTVAKPCCRTGSFLEGFFGMTGIYAGLSAVTLTHLHLFVCRREYVLACAHYNKCKKRLKQQQLESGGARGGGVRSTTFNQNTVHNSKFNFLQD